MLTRKQYDLLLFINRRLEENGISPSFEEMKEALGLRSKSGVHRLITGLEERGFIRRLPHRARALEVLKAPEESGAAAKATQEASANVVRPNFASKPVAAEASAVALPLFGRIAAGTPIEALSEPERTVDIPPSMLGRGEHYALEIAGDSMIDAGIRDGDVAVIRRSDTADNGDIVVALLDDHEATLKRLRRKGKSVALEPANAVYETRIFGPDRVKVQGRLVGLIRHY
ncbi:MAG: transcriptional repressor LexA [Alphaproteobacteria bacterium]|jgi:repressor LexA|nr:transcriptional repressor LexA [Alphaproteobacteria bacterium]MDP6238327.1 transcriptional repressor LexA [Alphaproteobacteria bacterium]MDP7173141.1 transcriptional repressor LexA [Alphaproteobacteria bacterium]MDP7233532.1 transcriptional repressor LexA [Alphaproteobacteria bacterium]MDP7486490.1 transcriptional repressor LexA [Alphaproteobacteria bacterium]|tara:strand:+ start:3938 stop:4624 length:687 start_codon:yes stop_codon:yes gene_type:complete